VKVKTDKLMLM